MDLLQAAITDLADSAAIHPEADEAVLLGRDVRFVCGSPGSDRIYTESSLPTQPT